MTAHHHEPSVQELRRESERTRADLTNTVDQLRTKVVDTAEDWKNRASPAHIKAEVKEYVRDSGEQLFHTLERKARENPLQALAIGAGLAYPLWGIVRSIPAPIMLVGAGLLLTKPMGRAARGSFQQASDKATDITAEAKQRASELFSKVQDAAAQTGSRLSETAAEAGATLASRAKSISGKVDDIAGNARSAAADVVSALQNKAASAVESVTDTASAARDKAGEVGRNSRDAIMNIVDRNPLLVAGVGLAIGAFIAASLPRSAAENRLFGDTSDGLKDQARRAAAKGVQAAQEVAADVAGEVTAAAAREGLSPEGIKEAVAGLSEGVKSVADRGLKAALGGDSTSAAQKSTQTQKN
jgi:ElaB/YqjD/DUF883 family membrane-anchored ribosome-binding protein